MKAVGARTTAGLNLGAKMISSDNSGAKVVRLVAVKKGKIKILIKNALNIYLFRQSLRETQISQFYRYAEISKLLEIRQFCRYVGVICNIEI